MTSVKKVRADEKLENIINIIEADGCVVIENAISQGQLKSLSDDLSSHINKARKCKGDFYGYETTRLSGLFLKAPVTRKMALLPSILGVMDYFLLEHCSDYQINLTQAIQIGSEEIQQVPHRDDVMFPFAQKGFEAMINCMWAVTDFTKENGATHLVPGSHKWDDRERLPEAHEITQGEMEAGSVLIYLGSLIHNGGGNVTKEARTGAVISYCNGWLRQAENQYLAVPREEAAKFPEKLQRLLGYFVHKPNLGSVDGQDPIHLLKNQNIENLPFNEFIPDEVKPMIKEFRDRMKQVA